MPLIVQMRKPRPREMKQVGQDYITRKWLARLFPQDRFKTEPVLNLGTWAPKHLTAISDSVSHRFIWGAIL